MTEMTINWSLTRSFKKIQMRTRCSTVIVDTSTPAEPFTKTAGCWYGATYISCETLHLSIFILPHHAGKAKGASDGFRSRLSIQGENTIFSIEVIQISDAIAQPASVGCSSMVWVFPTSILQRKSRRCIYEDTA